MTSCCLCDKAVNNISQNFDLYDYQTQEYARIHLYVQYCIRMEITVLYFFYVILYVFLSFVLQQCQPTGLRHCPMKNCKHYLKIVTALKHTTKKTKKQTSTKTTKTFYLLKKHTYRLRHSELVCLECQRSWVQSKSYQNTP